MLRQRHLVAAAFATATLATRPPPSSRDQLIKHDMDFELRFDFFSRQLLRVLPPEWAAVAAPKRTTAKAVRH
jgi:hypothetical protein